MTIRRNYLLKAAKKFRKGNIILSVRMAGKMARILGFSTSNLMNSICKKRKENPKSVCHFCFAAAACKCHKQTASATAVNYLLYAGGLVSNEEIENDSIEIVETLKKNRTHEFRLEALGDIANKNHAINYLNLINAIRIYAKRTKYKVYVGFWTKNYNILINAFDSVDENIKDSFRSIVHLLVSSEFVNIPISREEKERIENALDMPVSVFTVYNDSFIEENDIEINCGARSCRKCLKCYRLKERGAYINERLK